MCWASNSQIVSSLVFASERQCIVIVYDNKQSSPLVIEFLKARGHNTADMYTCSLDSLNRDFFPMSSRATKLTKWQSMQWHWSGSRQPKEFKHLKGMATYLWSNSWSLERLQVYRETLCKLQSSGIIFFYNIASPHMLKFQLSEFYLKVLKEFVHDIRNIWKEMVTR